MSIVVLPFSKLNKRFFGYFQPDFCLEIITVIYFRGARTDNSVRKEAMVNWSTFKNITGQRQVRPNMQGLNVSVLCTHVGPQSSERHCAGDDEVQHDPVRQAWRRRREHMENHAVQGLERRSQKRMHR